MMLRWLVAGGLAAILGTGGSWLGRRAPVEQPIPFNHEVHVKGEEMACTDCHSGDTSRRSGFGDIRSCYECHKEAQGDKPSPAQEKVREYGKAKREIPWVAVNRNAGHVYFSHRAHVAFGNMKCEECHGDIGSMKESVRERNPRLHSMDACMDCHRERGATLQCISCHD